VSSSEVVRIVGLGAGGHAAVLIEAVNAAGRYEIVGLTDPRSELWGTSLLGVPILGSDDELPRQYDRSVSHAFIGVGGASDTGPRQRLYELARTHGFEIVSVIHPTAVVSPYARVGGGATFLANVVVNAQAELGENVLVNTGAIVEHDCRIGDHVHVATGACLASGVVVGDGAHVGAGSTVLQGRSIGSGAVVGAGAVVTHDVGPGLVVAGVPARPLRRSS
jgi:sugar O-acyltransferase (sialic acid O-acetyltransferase NeuD family)